MKKTRFAAIFFAAVLLIFTACSPQAAIRVNADNSGSVSFKMDSGKLIQSILLNLGVIQDGAPLFNREQIQTALTQAGLTVTALSFPSQTALDVTASIPDLQKLFSDSGFISVNRKADQHSIKLRINPQTVKQAVSLMPSDTADLFDLLIAPVLTGEKLTQSEYLELIGISYGASAAKELKNASFRFTVTVPDAVKKASVSNPDAASVSFSANTAVFILPLASFLTDLRTSDYEIEW